MGGGCLFGIVGCNTMPGSLYRLGESRALMQPLGECGVDWHWQKVVASKVASHLVSENKRAINSVFKNGINKIHQAVPPSG